VRRVVPVGSDPTRQIVPQRDFLRCGSSSAMSPSWPRMGLTPSPHAPDDLHRTEGDIESIDVDGRSVSVVARKVFVLGALGPRRIRVTFFGSLQRNAQGDRVHGAAAGPGILQSALWHLP